jgi:hypothetical protein
MTLERELNLAAYGVIVAAALMVPRRTRVLGGVLYGWALSRGHGAGRDKLRSDTEAVLEDLFAQRGSIHERLTTDIVPRIEKLERHQSPEFRSGQIG